MYLARKTAKLMGREDGECVKDYRVRPLYAVRQRVGCKNVGGRHLPVNGPTIGHIIDGAYVPVAKEEPKRRPGRPKNRYSLTNWESIK